MTNVELVKKLNFVAIIMLLLSLRKIYTLYLTSVVGIDGQNWFWIDQVYFPIGALIFSIGILNDFKPLMTILPIFVITRLIWDVKFLPLILTGFGVVYLIDFLFHLYVFKLLISYYRAQNNHNRV